MSLKIFWLGIKWLSQLLLLAVFLALAAVGCSSAPKEKTKVTLAYLDDPSREAVLYGITQGYVKSDKVDLEVSFLPLSAIIPAAQTKQFDLLEASVDGIAKAAAAGLNYVIVSPGLENRKGTILVTASDSPIKSPADLKGKKIGLSSLGGTFTLETRYVLKQKYGLNTNLTGGDVQFSEVPVPAVPAALKNKTIDAAVVLHAPAYSLISSPDFKVLLNVTEEFQAITKRSSMNSAIVTYPEVVAKKKEALLEVRRMLADSLSYFSKNRTKVLDEITIKRNLAKGFMDWWWGAYSFPQGPVTSEAKAQMVAIWEASKTIADIKAYPSVDDIVLKP